MTELEINRQIKTELRIAFQKLGGSPMLFERTALVARTPDRIASEFAKQKAPFDLLCIIGSWGDTLSPDEVLHGLRLYNRYGITFCRIMCAVEPDRGRNDGSRSTD